jgi:hypothetical protein
LRDLPDGPEYGTRIAAFPEKDFVIVGGPKVARLLRLSTGDELAKVGDGYTNFAPSNESGTLLFAYTSDCLATVLGGTPGIERSDSRSFLRRNLQSCFAETVDQALDKIRAHQLPEFRAHHRRILRLQS